MYSQEVTSTIPIYMHAKCVSVFEEKKNDYFSKLTRYQMHTSLTQMCNNTPMKSLIC